MRALTEDYALIIAEAVREKLGATWGLCESGAIGSTSNSYGDVAGHVVVALSGPKTLSRTMETGSEDREGNMWRFAGEALALLLEGLAVSLSEAPLCKWADSVKKRSRLKALF